MKGTPEPPATAAGAHAARGEEPQDGKVELIRRSQGTLGTYSVLIAVTAVCTPYARDHTLIFTLLAVPQVLLAVARWLVVSRVRQSGSRWGTRSWRTFHVLTLACAVTWGVFAAYPLIAYGMTETAMVTVIFTAGLLAGGTSTLSLVPSLYLPWLVLMVAPLIAASVWLRSSEGAALGIASLVCAAMLQRVGRKANATYREGVEKSRLLESASRAKDHFLAHMSHEIRTPLTVILGMAELLRHGQGDPVDPRKLDSLDSAASSLSRIVDDVLDFSRIEEGGVEPQEVSFDPRQAVESAAATMHGFARSRGLRLEHGVSPDIPARVVGDPGRLHQVLLNLIGNAIKFTEQGHVEVRLHAREHGTDRCLLEFAIHDTGIGIAPDRLDAVFAPFTQADQSIERKYGGTGLGLTISSRLVSLMGGTITAESRQGVGSEFRFTVDVAIAEDAHTARGDVAPSGEDRKTQPSPGAAYAGNGLHILSAEDNPQVAQIIATVLGASGHDVDVVPNGRLAVQAVERRDPLYDVVLMDLEMPEMNGIEAAQRIRALEDPRVRGIPIIAVTGHASKDHARRSLEAGIDEFVTKPVNFAELGQVIRGLVNGRSTS